MSNRPNILFITSDQQRYDCLGKAANNLLQTPCLDQLAREGVHFSNAFANNPICVPSRACIQTGRYCHQHGVRRMTSAVVDTPGLPLSETTFMELLQQSGYQTAACGKIHMFPPRGFDYMQLTDGQGSRWDVPHGSPIGPAQLGDTYAHWLEQRNPGAYTRIYEQRRSDEYKRRWSAVKSILEPDEYVDAWAVECAELFVREQWDENRPFLLWLGFCNPHTPVDAPGHYAEMYDPNDIVLSEKYLRRPDPDVGPDEETMRIWVAHYYGLCTFIDDLTQRMLDCLRDRGALDDTLVVYTSDHGEMMGSLGRFGKGNFYEEVIHVPLIARPPVGQPMAEETAEGLTELIDIAPTLLDYAELPVPKYIEGISLRPVIEGREPGGKASILCEFANTNEDKVGVALRDQRYKYCHWSRGAECELYDLQTDPLEMNNLAHDPEHTELLSRMRADMLSRIVNAARPILRR